MNECHMRKSAAKEIQDKNFGKNLSFAAAEAYKLLRTNVMFSLPAEEKCRVIGVTSALPREGKSTTSLNLAYMLAEMGYKVRLIEADMRLPTISRRLEIKTEPGLSNLLTGIKSGTSVLQNSGIHDNLCVVSAGNVPPNPSELLGSKQMETVIDVMSESASFIILDLPPITEVSDALVASKLADGMIMVVRQNYANRRAVAEAVRQLNYVEAKLLGFVLTCANGQIKGSYKKYGKKYGKYGYGYGKTEKKAERSKAKKEKQEKRAEKKKKKKKRNDDQWYDGMEP